MSLPIVTILGRPNVGKSSLLNMLAGERISIVDPRAGITRDRVSAIVEHNDRYFELIDTGGIGIIDDDQLEEHVEQQIQLAIHKSDLILFVVDTFDGVTPLDLQVAMLLRPLQKKILLIANKVDEPKFEADATNFHQLGYGEPIAVAATHGRGREFLLTRILQLLGPAAEESPAETVMKLAIVGKRNAGKSTLVNALAGEERMIVSEIPGTTRDAVDVVFEQDGRQFIAIDTAGVRKKSSMDDIDYYSYTRALRSIRRSDVVMLLIDAEVPIGDVDIRLARAILEENRPVVITINKWDLVLDRATPEDYAEYLSKVIPWLDFAPIVFITAKDGRKIHAAVDVAMSLHNQANMRVGTGKLNTAMETVLGERAPSSRVAGRLLRIYYATQISVAPPTIVLFCNDAALVRDDYRRFVQNRMREILPFREVPIRLIFRSRSAEPRHDGKPSTRHSQET